MTQFPDTRASLLMQVGDLQDRDAWEQFEQIYRPLIYRLARQRGMQDADAQDLSQQVLMSVASAVGRWKRNSESARFRHWLRRVARNAILNALSRRPRDLAAGGSSVQELLTEQTQVDEEAERRITLEYRRELYLQAADRVRADVDPETWLAFKLTVIEGHGIEMAEEQLSKSAGSIYAARSRIMRRLREAVRELEDADE